MNIGLIIAELLEKNDISQKEFSTALNVSKSTVSMWKHQNRNPDIDMLIKIAQYFDVSTDYLLGLSTNYSKNASANAEKEDVLDEKSKNLMAAFSQLTEDNKDIAIGEVKKLLKDQRLEAVFSDSAKAKREAL